MNRLDELKDTVEVDEEAMKVILHWPNVSKEYDLHAYKHEYYTIMSRIHRRSNSITGYIELTAASLLKDSGIKEANIPCVDLTEKARVDKLNKLQHHRDTTVGLWATDMPQLFSDHPKFDLMFEIKD